MLTVYALPGGGASVEIERESSLPGVGRVAAGWRKRPATLTMRRVRSFSSLARWNEPPRARSAARDRSNGAFFLGFFFSRQLAQIGFSRKS